ncbi:MAG: DNA-directed RNA polymerase subunit beta' [Eubacteriales bacterium]|uniref:DNA-directed RNA polymerase subunit beta' n=1 Tax=Fenollaria sp. TaxID=1965292 RepID=UPI002A7500E1|nr:DNA-directed RNA polymerase subunit beta' [Fenollaria sp.]MDD7340013.1 DNA-directed RNA polymerase subunit beta' [Eubacteriales bacterium]MDY3105479.1 DNA-directed RNA polymerase subunit beta' [Fenollaria sp.]
MFELNKFNSIQIGLASSQDIREWSKGEVKKPETINYRTLKPEAEGLFCEKIFGPVKDWTCHCGKYNKIRYKGMICDKCGVEITRAKVRRERMGHIELASPCTHIWYLKGTPSRIAIVLDVSPKELEHVVYFASYIVMDPGKTGLKYKQILNEQEYSEAIDMFGYGSFDARMGAEAILELLKAIDLDKEAQELTEELEGASTQKKIKVLRKLETIESFRQSGNRPEWMVIEALPVIPPDLRPMVQLDGGRFATSDLNDLYRRVINRNNRLRRLLELNAPEIITRNEKRMLQEAVDALIDNGRRGRAVTGPGNRPLKSLSDMIKGKQGRFRQNLLGKRVDYSGRSVIVVGPKLKFYQCGLPKMMALELFKPFVMRRLVETGKAHNIKSAKRMVERAKSDIWDVLEYVIKDHPVLLNRAPTLHRLGIQAFEPVLVEGKAIKLHPLVCSAYNADFDGDQMAVHLPLSIEAQAEARLLMLSINNILAPKDGKPISIPSQDMVLGCYYMTLDIEGSKGSGHIFEDYDEMIKAYQLGLIDLHARVKVRVKIDEEDRGKLVESTVGRFILNKKIPQDLGFVNREEDPYSLEIDRVVSKKTLGTILDKCYQKHGNIVTSKLLDHIKSTGYKHSTLSAVSISMADVVVPKEKTELIDKAQKEVEKYERAYRDGFMTEEERYEGVINIWNGITDEVTEALMKSLDPLNNIFIMADSGARGSKNQIRQLGGMRGLMASSTGKTVEIPIKSNFREGLSVLEFFLSSHGSRKGLSDIALKTADSGYLTRRLVDVSQDVIVTEDDCHSDQGHTVRTIRDGKEILEELEERLVGRYAFEDIVNPKDGSIIVKKDELIDEETAHFIQEIGIEEVKVRSVLTCQTKHGVCAKCYGRNLATGNIVNIGESVGIIAAQSIGEPGTQLTMRNFHSGGVANADDITQGLPRVEELFEARKPKGQAQIAQISGTVSINEDDPQQRVIVITDDKEGIAVDHPVNYAARLKVHEGDYIEKGKEITEGNASPQEIMKVLGVEGVEDYIIKEVQRVYRMTGIDINDKHIEIICKQMLKKVRIEAQNDSSFLPGALVNIYDFIHENKKLKEEGKVPAEGKRILLGISKSSLATDSFLSAASFQETTRVLTEAAIRGKKDELVGLKENVIIGKIIPAGTGMLKYRNIKVKEDETVLKKQMEEEMKRKKREIDDTNLFKDFDEDEKDKKAKKEEDVKEEVKDNQDAIELDKIIKDLLNEEKERKSSKDN